MNWDDFATWGARISDWAKGYHRTLRDRPVRAQVAPGDILAQLPTAPPQAGESMDAVFADFEKIVMPGLTHWQHPRFFAYFPANATPPSMLADYLATVIAPQCMLWQTSPAATEMETRMLQWLRQSLGLADHFEGVIQDSASTATLAAVLTMRERALGWQGNEKGLSGLDTLRIYCSEEVHTSVDRAIWIAGVGQDNLCRVPTHGPLRSMQPDALEAAIKQDLANGLKPAGIVACVGGTGTGGCDDISAVCDIAAKYDLYVHVDAAWAGAAMICPEYRHYWEGVDKADSVVFNPHKWLGMQFDCSAHFVKNPDDLVRTLAIRPEYLKTHGADGIINYSEWSVPLGRRFRALKIWFVLRIYGLDGLQQMIRNHVTWAHELRDLLAAEPDFEIVTEPVLSLFTFRYAPDGATDLDALNQRLVDTINNDGRIYITQTRTKGQLVIRFQAGQVDATREDVLFAFDTIKEIARALS
ncbi:pyridoxal-dependent decarboxylase [Shimia sp. CNT1-13L.2]|uniref:pyridoxal phosphate-dependent decarboxylase family protein n=1 Tax=Shimia sp. CNT1-13L.2 TaxID=2959663 RepID=UPI0020CC8287|nr:pyridoxal-dependent decarboxylase [Shimia sp. CNT1-13L.2]MCP9482958.1 pyridoxal-dependent decarboxylase [Shimia sp. CNT1-13L.2]